MTIIFKPNREVVDIVQSLEDEIKRLNLLLECEANNLWCDKHSKQNQYCSECLTEANNAEKDN